MNKESRGEDWAGHWALADKFALDNDRVPASAYTLPEVFETERAKIFRRTWLPVARESEVAEPGDFVRCPIEPLQAEALVVRGKDGVLRAFHNACRHRGAAIESACRGQAKAFVCPYHAWTYDLDGKLKGLPGKECFPQVEIGREGLTPIRLETWNGFVFLNFSEQQPESLTDYLGSLGVLMDGLPLDDYPHMVELTWNVDANWKILMEASNEAYHVSALHKWSLSEQLTSAENPLNHGYDAVFSPPHATATIQANLRWRPEKPVVDFVYQAEAFRGQPGGANSEQEDGNGPTPFLGHAGVNRIGLPSMSAEIMLLFPLTCLQILANRYIWFQYWPVAVDKTRFVLRIYMPSAPSSYREAFAEAHMATYSRDIASEDAWMAATQHRSLKGGGVKDVLLGENECVIRFFHKMIAEYLAK